LSGDNEAADLASALREFPVDRRDNLGVVVVDTVMELEDTDNQQQAIDRLIEHLKKLRGEMPPPH
jgi:superfamily II helicase